MAMDMLRQLAGSPLPATFHNPEEIDKIRLLRAAGLVIALTPSGSPTESALTDAAQVLAITQKGREELGMASLPGDRAHSVPPTSQGWRSRWNAMINPHHWQ